MVIERSDGTTHLLPRSPIMNFSALFLSVALRLWDGKYSISRKKQILGFD